MTYVDKIRMMTDVDNILAFCTHTVYLVRKFAVCVGFCPEVVVVERVVL